MAKFDGVLLDLDGTLWNSIRTILPTWNRVAEKAGIVITEEKIASVMGKGAEEIAEIFFGGYGTAEDRLKLVLEGFAEECVDLRRYGGDLYPGVDEMLRLLAKEYRLAIISNCGDGYIESFLEAHGFSDCITDYEHPGRTGLTKGENIRLVMERNGIRSAVYIGDTQGDANAVKAAGLPFVYASYGFGTVNPADCAAVLHSFGELPDLLAKL